MYNDEPWYAVKCVFSHPTRVKEEGATLFEERITLWRANSCEEAFEKAKHEAELYAHEEGCVLIKATDAFHLFDGTIDEGAEVWSTMRESNLKPEYYLKTFCITEGDRISKKEAEPDDPDQRR